MSLPCWQDEQPLNDYEQQRAARILRNQQVMEEMGIVRQATLLETGLRARKGTQTPRSEGKLKKPVSPSKRRASTRLANLPPENKGLVGDERECHGHLVLAEEDAAQGSHEERWAEYVSQHRCDSQSRGSVYDSRAGICCHFCRQKKLCGEPECQRCIQRNPDLPCIGKSECTRCASATGRFCRACLLVRYGTPLETVRAEMQAGTWLCPHCSEDDHPNEGWICNSSICMTRRGMKPTGIAIFEAQQKGFASVGHYVQAQILARKGTAPGGAAGAATAAPAAKAPAAAKAAAQAAAPDRATADGAAKGAPLAPATPAKPGVEARAGASSATTAAAAPGCAEKPGKENAQGPYDEPTAGPFTPVKRPLQARMAASEGRVTRRQSRQAGRLSMTPPPGCASQAPVAGSVRLTRAACRRLIA